MGVYLALSVLDFPFCFLLVKWAGTERIGECFFFLFGPLSTYTEPTVASLSVQLTSRTRERGGEGEGGGIC